MQDIKVGRYSDVYGINPVEEIDGRTITHEFSGWIEDEDRTWIIFLDEHGKPAFYWAERDELGGTIGEPVRLAA